MEEIKDLVIIFAIGFTIISGAVGGLGLYHAVRLRDKFHAVLTENAILKRRDQEMRLFMLDMVRVKAGQEAETFVRERMCEPPARQYVSGSFIDNE